MIRLTGIYANITKAFSSANRCNQEAYNNAPGSIGTLEHEQGLIITTSDFSSGARKEAARPDATPVALMNGDQLVLLLVEHEIGVTRESHDLLEISGEF